MKPELLDVFKYAAVAGLGFGLGYFLSGSVHALVKTAILKTSGALTSLAAKLTSIASK